MLSINTNVSATSAANQIGNAQKGLASSMEKLTTGVRINRAADDVAGSALASRFESFQTRTEQFIRNAEDGINMIQTFDGALEQTDSLIQRMKVLVTQASNGSNSAEDKGLIQKELDQLIAEITRNAESTTYNGINITGTAPTAATVDIGIGRGAANVITLTSQAMDATTLGIDGMTVDVTAAADAAAFEAIQAALDTASATVNSFRADLGAAQNRTEFAIDNLTNLSENTSAALANMQDTDFAAETAELAKQKVLAATSQAMLKQANEQTQAVQQLIQ